MEIGKVYVIHNEWIQDPETGNMPYKIGITKNLVEDRFYGLGLKMPGEFICDFAYEFSGNYAKVEKTLHSMLNQLNVNGEWFNVNEEALEGIRNICELAGGKLITEEIENEIENETLNEINPDLKIIVDEWNKRSDEKAIGKSSRWRSINIPGVNIGVNYKFSIINSKEISIQLGCWTKVYKDFDQVLKGFNGLEINGNTFLYKPPSLLREKDYGWKGTVQVNLPTNKIDEIVDTMEKFINQTKTKVIESCKG
ncbi:MAG: GIY-YIG nuclease family protein [Treponema sp.]|nr:GIY-YIG nuclease family protein [Treponema sp.]